MKKNKSYLAVFVGGLALLFALWEINPTQAQGIGKRSAHSIPIVVGAVDRIKYSSPISGFIEHIFFKEGEGI